MPWPAPAVTLAPRLHVVSVQCPRRPRALEARTTAGSARAVCPTASPRSTAGAPALLVCVVPPGKHTWEVSRAPALLPVLCSPLELGRWLGGGVTEGSACSPTPPRPSPSHLTPPTQCSTGLMLARTSEGGPPAEGKSRAVTWMTTGRNRERQSLPGHQG